MKIITTTGELETLCRDLGQDPYITVDTEFMRERTYWAKLCLIQIAGAEHEAIVDPQADGLDLSSFFELMANESIVKVFHAARQDVEIIHHLSGVIPKPLFDTQIAAMVCGFGDQIGYEPLVRRLVDAQIDKSSRFTDWSRRPLSDKQLHYALSDVTHLRGVYEKLKTQLDTSGREPWLTEEMKVLTDEETYQTDPEKAWLRVKYRPRKKIQQAILMDVAAWREKEAQHRDVPRNRIIKDDAIGELAMQAPKDQNALSRLRAVPRGYANSRHGEAIVAAVKRGLARDLNDVPDVKDRSQRLPEGVGEIAEILKLALKITAEQEGIAARIIANAADIEAIAGGKTDKVKTLKGWRRDLFGQVALNLKAGKLAIGLRDGKAAIFSVADQESDLKAAE
ncbi:Ribonuclease D [hydrothermal vent metagenome]|uniref:Ribonuclease D n=1 Tax=hydrothermal vent metagenome TaxID=652676 RepID=A0A3B0QYA3_9ZZZZ